MEFSAQHYDYNLLSRSGGNSQQFTNTGNQRQTEALPNILESNISLDKYFRLLGIHNTQLLASFSTAERGKHYTVTRDIDDRIFNAKSGYKI